MREVYHKYILAAFAALLAFSVGYCVGYVSSLNWVIKTATDHFGLNVTIDHAEVAQAIFRYLNHIG